MPDKRRRVRVGMSNYAFAQSEHKSFEGSLEDISANGASLVLSTPLDAGQTPFKRGDSIEITIDDLTSLSGWIVRSDNISIGIEFTHDKESEDQLIAELMETM